MPDKAFLREWAVSARKVLSNEERASSDLNIISNLLSLRQYQSAETVFCFASTDFEIDTTPIILDALSQNKRVCTPRCVSRGIMKAFEIKSLHDLENGKFDIREPKHYCSYVYPEEIDFAVVPCVTCDSYGNRVGYGGGYYDRYLSHTRFTTAAVCRERFLRDDIPVEAHDVRIDIVVTDEGVYGLST